MLMALPCSSLEDKTKGATTSLGGSLVVGPPPSGFASLPRQEVEKIRCQAMMVRWVRRWSPSPSWEMFVLMALPCSSLEDRKKGAITSLGEWWSSRGHTPSL